MSEASGVQEETTHVRDQWRPGEATSRARPGAVTLRNHPEPKARGGSWVEQPDEWWLCRHRRFLEELSHVKGQEQWQ